LSEEGLLIPEERREAKGKGEKERYTYPFECKEYNQSDFGIDLLVMSMC